MKFISIIAFFISFSVKSQELNTFSAGEVINSVKLNENFQIIKNELTKVDENFNMTFVQPLEVIEKQTFIDNFSFSDNLLLNFTNNPENLESNINSSKINSLFNESFSHITNNLGGTTCLRTKLTGKTNSNYILKFDERYNIECDMVTDGGGWTEIAEINRGDTTWSLYDSDLNINSSIDSKRGFSLNRFSNGSLNDDLEFLISVDNSPKMIYSNLNLSNVFNHTIGNSTLQTDPFLYKTINGVWRSCNDNLLKNANNQWNWSIANTSSGCASYSSGTGFILHGNSSNPDEATLLYGLNQYSASSSWSKVEIFFREKENNNYPESCLDLYNKGERTSGTYTIDPDGEGKGISEFDVYCDMENDGGGWTLVIGFKGDNQDLSYYDDTNVGWKKRDGKGTFLNNNLNYSSSYFSKAYGYLKGNHIRISNGIDRLSWNYPYSMKISLYDLINDGAQSIYSAGSSSIGLQFNSSLSYRQSSSSSNLALRWNNYLKMKCQDGRSGGTDNAVIGFTSNGSSSGYYCEGIGYPHYGDHSYRKNTRWYAETVSGTIGGASNAWRSDSRYYQIWVK